MVSEIKTSKGELIKIPKKPFSSGGEGAVSNISYPTHYQQYCVKIYYSDRRTEEQRKRIQYVDENPPKCFKSDGYMISWPIETIFTIDGDFWGFIMPLAFENSIQLVNLSSTHIHPKLDSDWHREFSRENGVSSLVSRLKLMCNIATPVF